MSDVARILKEARDQGENSDSISRIFPRRTQWHSLFPLIQILQFNSSLIFES